MTGASDAGQTLTPLPSTSQVSSCESSSADAQRCLESEDELDLLLRELQRRAAALTVVMGVQDDAGTQVAESRLRRTSAVASAVVARLRATPSSAATIASFERALGNASFLLTLSSLPYREWAPHRALRWFECIARTAQQAGVRFRAAGPDLYEVNASTKHLDGVILAELHVQACVFSAGSLQCAVLDRSHIVSCDLRSADLRSTSWRRAAVDSSSFASGSLVDARLDEAVFVDCDLRDADLSATNGNATARSTRFVRCDLRGSKWEGRRLERASFVNCKMHGVRGQPILVDVCVRGADLSRAGDGYGSLRAAEAQAVWLA